MAFTIQGTSPDFTLALLIEKSWALLICCPACGHEAKLNPADILKRFGRAGLGATLAAVAERASCGACGSRDGGLWTKQSHSARVDLGTAGGADDGGNASNDHNGPD